MKQEAKIVHLLDCLQKTTPPVLIFAEKKQDVDAIHEYLLLKGIDAVAIHGGKGMNVAKNRLIKFSHGEMRKRKCINSQIKKSDLDQLTHLDRVRKMY